MQAEVLYRELCDSCQKKTAGPLQRSPPHSAFRRPIAITETAATMKGPAVLFVTLATLVAQATAFWDAGHASMFLPPLYRTRELFRHLRSDLNDGPGRSLM